MSLLLGRRYFFVLPKLSGAVFSPEILPDSRDNIGNRHADRDRFPPSATQRLPAFRAQTPDPFPDALTLKERFPFGSETLQAKQPCTNTGSMTPTSGITTWTTAIMSRNPAQDINSCSCLFTWQNNGRHPYLVPFRRSVTVVFYNGAPLLPRIRAIINRDKASGPTEAAPVEVKDVQYFHEVNGRRVCGGFWISLTATELRLSLSGASNSVDGYIVYEVPQSLTPEETYVAIIFQRAGSAAPGVSDNESCFIR